MPPYMRTPAAAAVPDTVTVGRMAIRLVRTALAAGESPTPPEDIAPLLPALMDFAERQQVLPLIADGLLRMPIFAETDAAVAVACRAGAYAAHGALQTEVAERLLDALEAAGIRHMPLKGYGLKTLYPSPDFRVMGDVDILVTPRDRARIEALLGQMRYAQGKESDHEYHWFSPEGVHIELHKSLIPTYDRDLYAYFGDGWSRARPVSGFAHRMELSPEDTYVYLVAHMAKHCRGGGVGMRYAVDLYVFRRACLPNEDGVARELRAVGLEEFEQNVRRLCRFWFADGDADDVTRLLEERLFSGGVYGNPEEASVSEGTRARQMWRAIFPAYATMCHRRGRPFGRWQLPFRWVARWGELLLRGRRRVRRKMGAVVGVRGAAVAEHRATVAAVGLPPREG